MSSIYITHCNAVHLNSKSSECSFLFKVNFKELQKRKKERREEKKSEHFLFNKLEK